MGNRFGVIRCCGDRFGKCTLAVGALLVVLETAGFAQMPHFAVEPNGPKTSAPVKPKPGERDSSHNKAFRKYAEDHKVMRPNRKKVTMWDAQRDIDTRSPYGRIAADCMNQQDNLSDDGMRRANRCIETRTKAYEASLKRKGVQDSAEAPVVEDSAPTAGDRAGTTDGAEAMEGDASGSWLDPE